MNKQKSVFQQTKKVAFAMFMVTGLLALFVTKSAHAFVNNGFFLSLANEPDIASSGIDVVYDADAIDASTGVLTADGFATNLSTGGGDFGFAGGFGLFDLDVQIDNATGDAIGGTLSITGEIPGLGFGPGDILTGTLSGFGSQAGSEALQFLFELTGGEAAGLFGSSAGVILSNTGIPGGNGNPVLAFVNDFSNGQFAGVADTAGEAVPEPGTLGLMLTGGLILYSRRRRTFVA